MKVSFSAIIAAIFCMLFWGFSFISTKIVAAVFPPMSIGALRFAAAIVILFVIRRLVLTKKGAAAAHISREKFEGGDIPYLAGAGISGVTLYFFFENNGLTLITASEASIITAAIPVLMIAAEWGADIYARRVRKQGANPHRPVPYKQWLGALVSMTGVWLVAQVSFSSPSGGSGGMNTILGYLCMGGAALSWVVYSFLTRPLFSRHSRLFIIYWQSVFGFFGFVPFALLEIPQWGVVNIPIIFHLSFLGFCCSALAYWLYAKSMENLGLSLSSLFINLIPVVTVIAGFFVLNERLKGTQWLGAVLVLAGVYFAVTVKDGGRPCSVGKG
ncbi:MAG: DMT family transporter [Treponema sp.]|jgi:drug/metabolite transporter (DMT)-like permease|nr:DMT family transporter [Treponema sp.]